MSYYKLNLKLREEISSFKKEFTGFSYKALQKEKTFRLPVKTYPQIKESNFVIKDKVTATIIKNTNLNKIHN